jgi:hypothetical protein
MYNHLNFYFNKLYFKTIKKFDKEKTILHWLYNVRHKLKSR